MQEDGPCISCGVESRTKGVRTPLATIWIVTREPLVRFMFNCDMSMLVHAAPLGP